MNGAIEYRTGIAAYHNTNTGESKEITIRHRLTEKQWEKKLRALASRVFKGSSKQRYFKMVQAVRNTEGEWLEFVSRE